MAISFARNGRLDFAEVIRQNSSAVNSAVAESERMLSGGTADQVRDAGLQLALEAKAVTADAQKPITDSFVSTLVRDADAQLAELDALMQVLKTGEVKGKKNGA